MMMMRRTRTRPLPPPPEEEEPEELEEAVGPVEAALVLLLPRPRHAGPLCPSSTPTPRLSTRSSEGWSPT